jgi:ATP-dependent DNA helicase RecG
LAKEVGITEDGIKWYISKLKTKGRIRRVGSDKGGHWEVIENQP